MKVTVIDGATATRSEELILYDRGGLLSADGLESAKKASHRSDGMETV